MAIHIKRVYEEPAESDGLRVLVDRVWPRGLRKADAAIDLWMKEVAPSTELRKWFGHEPARWDDFRDRYAQELGTKEGPVRELAKRVREGAVTLLYAARDEEHNNAVALRDYLRRRLK